MGCFWLTPNYIVYYSTISILYYSLLVGYQSILKFDGIRFLDLSSEVPKGTTWADISWMPDGNALIKLTFAS